MYGISHPGMGCNNPILGWDVWDRNNAILGWDAIISVTFSHLPLRKCVAKVQPALVSWNMPPLILRITKVSTVIVILQMRGDMFHETRAGWTSATHLQSGR